MPRSKGSNIVTVRKLVDAAAVEAALLTRLSGEDADTYRTTQAMSWVDIEAVARIFAAAAQALYPTEAQALRRLGRAIAEDNLRGMYRLFLRVVSISFAIGQAARIWSTYNDTGLVRVEHNGEAERLRLRVADYPLFPDATLEETAGYIEGLATFCGARTVDVRTWREGQASLGWDVRWSM